MNITDPVCSDYQSKSGRYERSRSPARNGTRVRSRTPPPRGPKTDDRKDTGSRDGARQSNGTSDAKGSSRARDLDGERDVDMRDIEEDPDDIEALMRKTMGFGRFRSTKNTKIPGNNVYGVRKEKKTEYRQYMNRTGGFNRPLSPSR
jgi:U4/U6.U5 tri-snRNP-associated protein 3